MSEIKEVALTESRTLRDQYAGRTDVLDKVKALSLLPDGVHADIPMVAAYYEVTSEAVKKVVQRNREELGFNGLNVLTGPAYREFARDNLSLANPNARSVTLFTRRTILNVGQLLTESHIAQAVRTYLLDVEDIAGADVRNEATDRAAVSRAQLTMLDAARNIVDVRWLDTKARTVIARGLGEEPDIEPDDMPLYVPDFLKGKGLGKADIESVQSWFGRRVASLYEAEHGEKPGKRASELPNGQIRETYAWTQRNMPLFEEAWNRWYADRYPAELALIEGGA